MKKSSIQEQRDHTPGHRFHRDCGRRSASAMCKGRSHFLACCPRNTCACVRTVQTANSCCRSALPAQQEAPALAALHRPRLAAPGSPLLLPGGPPKGGTRAADDLRGLPGYKRRGKSNTATVNTLPIADVVTRLGDIRAMTRVNFCYCSTCKGADGLCAVICADLQHRLDVSRCLSTHTHTHTHTQVDTTTQTCSSSGSFQSA